MSNQNFKKNELEYLIKIIDSKDTYKVRHPILRAGKPITSCVFDGDDLNTTIHFGIFIESKLIGVCSFLKNRHPLITELEQYQLRGMAILKAYQRNNLGKIILDYGEAHLKNKKTNVIWCHAREISVPFYKKSGYSVIGEPFIIDGIGLHYIMCKNLKREDISL